MRPITLTVSALGTYKDITTINFNENAVSVFYSFSDLPELIFYALFGGENIIRCADAANDMQSYVELSFDTLEGRYTIKRNPSYERPKLRGNGFVKANASVILTFPDGHTIHKGSDVDKAISSATGLDKNNFDIWNYIIDTEKISELLNQSEDIKSAILKAILDEGVSKRIDRMPSQKVIDSLKAKKESLTQSLNEVENGNDSSADELSKEVESIEKAIAQAEEAIEALNNNISSAEIRIDEYESIMNAPFELEKSEKEAEKRRFDIEKLEISVEKKLQIKSDEQSLLARMQEIDNIVESANLSQEEAVLLNSRFTEESAKNKDIMRRMQSNNDKIANCKKSIDEASKRIKETAKLSEDDKLLKDFVTGVNEINDIFQEMDKFVYSESLKVLCETYLDMELEENLSEADYKKLKGAIFELAQEGNNRIDKIVPSDEELNKYNEELALLTQENDALKQEYNSVNQEIGFIKGKLASFPDKGQIDVLLRERRSIEKKIASIPTIEQTKQQLENHRRILKEIEERIDALKELVTKTPEDSEVIVNVAKSVEEMILTRNNIFADVEKNRAELNEKKLALTTISESAKNVDKLKLQLNSVSSALDSIGNDDASSTNKSLIANEYVNVIYDESQMLNNIIKDELLSVSIAIHDVVVGHESDMIFIFVNEVCEETVNKLNQAFEDRFASLIKKS